MSLKALFHSVNNSISTTVSAFRNQSNANEKLEQKKKKKALIRQRAIERTEIKQSWRFVFGKEAPIKRSEIYVIRDLTLRQLWMEENHLYNMIIALKPGTRFHPVEEYCLQWKPKNSPYEQLIPLNNYQVQESAMRQISTFSRRSQKKILFHLTTINPNLSVFAPHIHPSSLVSYRTKPEILNKLCEYYRTGRINLEDFTVTLKSRDTIWKNVLYNLLPADEQEYHEYLKSDDMTQIILQRSLEKQYLNSEISLKLYNDMKFPERKRKKDEEESEYPKPYIYNNCIICQETDGVIKCPSCENVVCIACIQEVFLDPDSTEGAFIFLHRRHCMKFGRRLNVQIEAFPVPAYLRELRVTGIASITKILPENNDYLNSSDFDEEYKLPVDDEEIIDEVKREQELEQKRLEWELTIRSESIEEIPSQAFSTRASLDKLIKSFETRRRVLIKFQKQLEESGHTEFYIKRILKLKEEARDKLLQLEPKLADIHNNISAMSPGLKVVKDLERDAKLLKFRLRAILEFKDLAQLEELETNSTETTKLRENVNLLMLFS